ncbi:MAG TPA: nucleotide sugar dehydrogenase [Stellaceae bacterium]|nr:nucleotide sugar dehydrogenase [Stellaceae bacterium]
MSERLAVIGLGYVGLPVAVALAQHFGAVVGFDVSTQRVSELRRGFDRTETVDQADLTASRLTVSDDPESLAGATFFIVTVPTPIDAEHRPDLDALRRASATVGRALRPGGVVVYESTVFPGLTEGICRPILAAASGLEPGRDFHVGYSPERINPGDRDHSLARVVKIVSAEDQATLDRVVAVYGPIVPAGLHRAPSIQVAEAAKVIENTQRDLNIALMNELAMIFDRLGLSTRDVLAAARTKWNFLGFTPGLVGGHCIGVDPYYLTARAEAAGYTPEVILAGRRINDGMGRFVAQRVLKSLTRVGRPLTGARVAVLGLTFKEDVGDLRNSRVPDILSELSEFGIHALVHDPSADPVEARQLCGVDLTALDQLGPLDALILAVPHRQYLAMGTAALVEMVAFGGVLADVKGVLDPAAMRSDIAYWSL